MTAETFHHDTRANAQTRYEHTLASQAADHYRRLAEDLDHENRLLTNAKRYPHYGLYAESDGIHIVIESIDIIHGIHRTDHVEPDWDSAFLWARRHYNLIGSNTATEEP
jgi:hypothetical protein